MNTSGKNELMKQYGCCTDDCLDGEKIGDLVSCFMTSAEKLRAILLGVLLLAHVLVG